MSHVHMHQMPKFTTALNKLEKADLSAMQNAAIQMMLAVKHYCDETDTDLRSQSPDEIVDGWLEWMEEVL